MPRRPPEFRAVAAAAATALRRHWVAAILITAGLVLRILAQLAYRPALLYVDTLKYLYSIYPGSDPVGYQVPLRLILVVGNLNAVAAIQHLLGLAIAGTIYVILIRRGTGRWLAALAIAPVLLDGYQVQIEQTIMPDVWFEALIVAGIAVLLARSDRVPGLRATITAGLILGASATVRQVGEILILPALLYLVALGGRQLLTRTAALIAAFAVPIIGYSAGSYLRNGHFWLAGATPSISSYGRMATAADCATLSLPGYQRALCPTAREQAYGPDWLDHDIHSPLKTYVAPAGMNRFAVIAAFNREVLTQQPQRVLAAIGRDTIKLFALTRTSSQGGTPISRWQFQDFYPTYPNWITVRPGRIVIGLPQPDGSFRYQPLPPGSGGAAHVDRPIAAFLRGYQLDGGYTPGPLMLIFVLAGLAGSLLVLARRQPPARHGLTLACLLCFGCGGAILLMSDVFQFSWRYQLPALVTLPPAGVLGIAAVLSYRAGRSAGGPSGEQRDEQPELASPVV